MTLTPTDVQHIHAVFGTPDELVSRRRAVYRLTLKIAAARMGEGSATPDLLSLDVIDNPAVRAHLAEVLSGVVEFNAERLHPMTQLTIPEGRTLISANIVRLASTRRAARVLAGALECAAVAASLEIQLDDALVLAGSSSFDSALQTLIDGVRLAVDVAPELALDLLPHVAMFAVISEEAAGEIGSASVRQFPGLILLPEPRTAVEVAEALIHEGAHQKLFDLAVSRSLVVDYNSASFVPPWAASDSAAWPFEQCVAAFHAYSCLSAFATALSDRPNLMLHAHSLLPEAAKRARVLGGWLLQHGESFGQDGQSLVSKLVGAEFEVSPSPVDHQHIHTRLAKSSSLVVTERCGDWTLIMEWVNPAVIVWVPSQSVPDFDG